MPAALSNGSAPRQRHTPQRRELLRLILQRGPIARNDLADLAGLAPATISRVTADLMRARLIREVGPDTSVVGAGRRPILLEVNPAGAYVAALHIGTLHLDVALVNLRGEIVQHARLDQDAAETPTAAIARATAAIQRLAKESKIPPASIVAAGVTSGGSVDPVAGLLRDHPRLGWRKVPIGRAVARRLRLETTVDSNVNGMALAESWFGAGCDVHTLLLVHIGSVIDCALAREGELHRGAHDHAGHIGHIVSVPNGPLCTCGRRGCLEAVASDLALLRQAGAKEIDSLEAIMDGARAGDPWLRELVVSRAELVGRTLAALVTFYDPELIVIAGNWARDEQLQLAPLRQVLNANVNPALEPLVAVATTAFGADAPVIGAAALALRALYSPTFAGQPEARSSATSG